MQHRSVVIAGMLSGLLVAFVTDEASARASSWVTARATAEAKLPNRFQNIASISCSPDTTSDTQIFGSVRYWQRFWCSGSTYGHVAFRLRYEAKGQCAECWTITHLTGAGANDLRVRQSVRPQPGSPLPALPKPPFVPPTSLGSYLDTGSGHWIQDAGNGSVITLEDGSLWLIDPISRIDTAIWLVVDNITVLRGGQYPGYGYRLINTDEGEVASAKFLGFG
jgi:hypothetical protein